MCFQMMMSFLLRSVNGQNNKVHVNCSEYVSFASTLFMSEIKLIEQRKRICVVEITFFCLSILLMFKDMQERNKTR